MGFGDTTALSTKTVTRGAIEPTNVTEGHIWIDTSGNNQETKVYNGAAWELIVAQGPDTPGHAIAGSIWGDTGNNTFKRYDGAAWQVVGVTDHANLTGLADDDHPQYSTVPASVTEDSNSPFDLSNSLTCNFAGSYSRIYIRTTTGVSLSASDDVAFLVSGVNDSTYRTFDNGGRSDKNGFLITGNSGGTRFISARFDLMADNVLAGYGIGRKAAGTNSSAPGTAWEYYGTGGITSLDSLTFQTLGTGNITGGIVEVYGL